MTATVPTINEKVAAFSATNATKGQAHLEREARYKTAHGLTATMSDRLTDAHFPGRYLVRAFATGALGFAAAFLEEAAAALPTSFSIAVLAFFSLPQLVAELFAGRCLGSKACPSLEQGAELLLMSAAALCLWSLLSSRSIAAGACATSASLGFAASSPWPLLLGSALDPIVRNDEKET